jgi:hypothetical protein
VRSANSRAKRRCLPTPGQLERYDYEYHRNGTVNLFLVLDVHRPWRKVKVTERRAQKITPHACASSSMPIIPMPSTSASCRITCRPTRPALSIRPSRPPPGVPLHPQTCQLAQHGRDRVGVLRGQCLDRRIDDAKILILEITAWNDSEIPPAPTSNGCSQPTRPAPKWAAPIQTGQRVIITAKQY